MIPADAAELRHAVFERRKGGVEEARVPSRRIDRAAEVRPNRSQIVIDLEPIEAKERVPHDGGSESDRVARVIGRPPGIRDLERPMVGLIRLDDAKWLVDDLQKMMAPR